MAYNCPTSGLLVHKDTDTIARRLIDSCIFLTPEESDRIDALILEHTPEKPENAPTCEPDDEILAALEDGDHQPDWIEPTDADLLAIRNAGI
jgi:hypothetical protein